MITCLKCDSENINSTNDGYKCENCGYEWSLMVESFQNRDRK